MSDCDYDIVVVGGGFYGCCLALFLRSVTSRILVVEAGDGLLGRASRVNQARVHSGFHYPRSFTTAMRSRILQERFVRDFDDAVVRDFDMLYAIAARHSKVTAARFARMFSAIGSPLARAPRHLGLLFDPNLVEDVFICREFAFDWSKLRDRLHARLEHHGVRVRMNESVESVRNERERVVVKLSGGKEITSDFLFNVTYANVNALLLASGLAPLALKHEWAEVALIEPPPTLAKLAVTVMDGPFFSAMPYPAESLYSLTHVRYTPHSSWSDSAAPTAAPDDSRWRYMIQDAKRYLPSMQDSVYRRSLFEVKTVLTKNERDDGRPVLLHQHADAPRIYPVLGAKIDNIYDLFDALPKQDKRWRDAHAGNLERGAG